MNCIYCAWPHDTGHDEKCPVARIAYLEDELAETQAQLLDANKWLRDANTESLAQAEIIGKDIDRCDKLIMEKRGLECDLEKANALLDEVEFTRNMVMDHCEADPEWNQIAAILAKRRGVE